MFTSRYAIPVLYLMLLLVVFALELTNPFIVQKLALVPRNPGMLHGIVSTVFVHKNLEHLSSNFLPLAICLFGIFFFYKDIAFRVTVNAHLITGILIWIFARPAYHIGASGLVYALVFFALVSGAIRKNRKLMVFALIVLLFQSGLAWGMFPLDNEVSWESHLLGGITGTALAVVYRKKGPADDQPKMWEEELEEDRDEYSELL